MHPLGRVTQEPRTGRARLWRQDRSRSRNLGRYFYRIQLGYETLGRKDITYSSGNTFMMVLMRKTCRTDA